MKYNTGFLNTVSGDLLKTGLGFRFDTARKFYN